MAVEPTHEEAHASLMRLYARSGQRHRALEQGAGGTPSAVLVDAEGKVASELAVGAPAVLDQLAARAKT